MARFGWPSCFSAGFHAATYLISLFLLSCYSAKVMAGNSFQSAHLGLVFLRALLLVSATLFNFITLNYLSLTVTASIMFSAPIIGVRSVLASTRGEGRSVALVCNLSGICRCYLWSLGRLIRLSIGLHC